MVDKPSLTKPLKSGAPAAGCFGQLHPNEAYGAAARPNAEQVAREWQSVAERFYLLGYRDGTGGR